mmetsp:Transcript_14247/g.39552  ORF Transcript_14247/g.39552 Transcript_14247/m.39552 type:complete len:286 (+) Transcript_14247:923-1780(+)
MIGLWVVQSSMAIPGSVLSTGIVVIKGSQRGKHVIGQSSLVKPERRKGSLNAIVTLPFVLQGRRDLLFDAAKRIIPRRMGRINAPIMHRRIIDGKPSLAAHGIGHRSIGFGIVRDELVTEVGMKTARVLFAVLQRQVVFQRPSRTRILPVHFERHVLILMIGHETDFHLGAGFGEPLFETVAVRAVVHLVRQHGPNQVLGRAHVQTSGEARVVILVVVVMMIIISKHFGACRSFHGGHDAVISIIVLAQVDHVGSESLQASRFLSIHQQGIGIETALSVQGKMSV